MTTKKDTSPTVPSIELAGEGVALNQGAQVAIFVKGTDTFEKLRINRKVEIKLDDGTVQSGTVLTLKVDTLIDLITNYGAQSAYTYNRAYSATTLLAAMTDAAGGDPLDLTKLYTAVIVLIDHQVA